MQESPTLDKPIGTLLMAMRTRSLIFAQIAFLISGLAWPTSSTEMPLTGPTHSQASRGELHIHVPRVAQQTRCVRS
jgi:hypothetical protein